MVFLVSADLLASRFVHDTELPRALGRRQRGDAKVIPVAHAVAEDHRQGGVDDRCRACGTVVYTRAKPPGRKRSPRRSRPGVGRGAPGPSATVSRASLA